MSRFVNMSPERLDAVWKALADARRRRMLDFIRDTPGCTVGRLCAQFALGRTAILAHLRTLEQAGLVPRAPKVGRERRLTLDAELLRACSAWLERHAAPVSAPAAPRKPRSRRRT